MLQYLKKYKAKLLSKFHFQEFDGANRTSRMVKNTTRPPTENNCFCFSMFFLHQIIFFFLSNLGLSLESVFLYQFSSRSSKLMFLICLYYFLYKNKRLRILLLPNFIFCLIYNYLLSFPWDPKS